MYKEINGFQFTLQDNVFVIDENKTMEKNAALNVLTPELIRFKEELKTEDNFRYIAVIAVSAGESWGANRNGDYFPRDELLKTYHTFEDGHLFEHHVNKDPAKSFGKIIKSFWNDRMDRVELIVSVDMSNPKGKKMMAELENGETIDVSMGCTVPFDVCSICGNAATKRSEYCDHLKFKMNNILPDGRKVYAININPKFFDISKVTRGAEVTAKVFAKVASDKSDKQAAIDKEIPADALKEIEPYEIKKYLNQKFLQDKPIQEEEYQQLSEYPDEDIIKTFSLMKVPLKPIEVRRIAGPGLYIMTDAPDTFAYAFNKGRFNRGLVKRMLSLIMRRSFIPHLIANHDSGNFYNPDHFNMEDPGYKGYIKVASMSSKTELNDIYSLLGNLTKELANDILVEGGKNLQRLEEEIYQSTIRKQDQIYSQAFREFNSPIEHQPYYASDPRETHYKMIYKAASDETLNIYNDFVVNFLKNKGGNL
jgi:hypothetical protein